MSFGWSAGDIFAAIKLVNQIVSCIRNTGGAREHFQELVTELQGLEDALTEIAELASSSDHIPEIAALKFASSNCGDTLQRFYDKIQPFQDSLGSITQSKWKASPRMVRWELLIKKDIPELRTYLVAHVGYLNMRLSTIILKNISSSQKQEHNHIEPRKDTSVSIKHINAEALALREKIGSISQRDTFPSLESLLAMAINIWRADNEIVSSLTDAKENLPPPCLSYTWVQAPVKFEDALGRIIPIPSEYDWAKIDAIIQAQFRSGFGSAKVRSREYELYDSSDEAKPMSKIDFSGLIPGTSITMAIIIGQYIGSEKCPRLGCGSHKSDFQGVFRHRVDQSRFTMCSWCGAWFRKSFRPLPTPLKPGFDNKRSSASEKRNLYNTLNERRSYKNISVYLHDLPPTPPQVRLTALSRPYNAEIDPGGEPTGHYSAITSSRVIKEYIIAATGHMSAPTRHAPRREVSPDRQNGQNRKRQKFLSLRDAPEDKSKEQERQSKRTKLRRYA